MTIEFAEQVPSGALGVIDVETRGVWARYSATIDEVVVVGLGTRPRIVQLRAQDQDGKDVPVGKAEHARVCALFLQSYERWRRSACHSLAPTARS